MVRKILIMLLPIFMIGCSSEEPLNPENLVAQKSSSIRSTDEAVELAKNAYSAFHSDSRSGIPEIESVSIIYGNKGRSDENDTLIYAINYKDDTGFALVAAPESAFPVLAITESGTYGSSLNTENSNFQFFLERIKDYVGMSTYGINPGDISIGGENPLKRKEVRGPRVKVTWNQQWPENIFCPNRVAGCFPVALAQVMSYLEYPTTMSFHYPEADVSVQSINWEELKKHKKSLTVFVPTQEEIDEHASSMWCGAEDEIHNVLARIIREIGHRSNSTYYSQLGVTDTKVINILSTITDFIPASRVSTYSGDDDIFDLMWNNQNVVAVITGHTALNEGHAWVLDGAMKMTIKSTLPDGLDIVGYYVHNNYGYNGESNGFYYEGVYNTGVTPEPVVGIMSRAGDNYTQNIKIYSIMK